MLVLTRKANEKIRIGDDVVITILRTKGKAVRLGIEAPGEMRVLRGEIAFDEDAPVDQQADDGVAPSKVAHARISRSQVATVLPSLAGSDGPLSQFVNNAAVTAH